MTPACEAMFNALWSTISLREPHTTAEETDEHWEAVATAGLEAAREAHRVGVRDFGQLERIAAQACCTRFWAAHPLAEKRRRVDPSSLAEEEQLHWWPAAKALLRAAAEERKAAA